MPQTDPEGAGERDHVVAANRAQTGAEVDDFTAERYQQMGKYLPKRCTDVLDVGCSTGRGGAALRVVQPSLRLTGMDCVAERLSALDSTVYADSILGFSDAIPAPDGSFDAILAGEFIEHVAPNQVEATLLEFFRVLRLGGRLVLTTPNPRYLRNRVRHMSVMSDEAHLSQHHSRRLKSRLETIGYSRVRILGSGRVSRHIGSRFPILDVYGSYLLTADKW